MSQEENLIQYISDPMCPWCYAFTPIFQKIKSEYANDFSFTYIAGGLRVRPEDPPMDEEFKDMLAGYWETVEMETGHKFDIDLVDNMNFPFNTEPGCRAMVTFRHLYHERIFEFEKLLIDTFYLKGLDLTIQDTFAQIIQSMKLDHEKFIQAFDSQTVDDLLEQDMIYTHSFEKPLLPMIVIKNGQSKNLITRGYSEYKLVKESIDQHLSETNSKSDSVDGPACDIDGGC